MVLLLPPHVPAVPPASLSFVYQHLPVLVIGRTFIINQLERLLRCLSLLRSDLLFFWTLINLSLLKKDTWNWSHRPARSKKSKVYFLDVFACFEQELWCDIRIIELFSGNSSNVCILERFLHRWSIRRGFLTMIYSVRSKVLCERLRKLQDFASPAVFSLLAVFTQSVLINVDRCIYFSSE